MLPAIFGLVGVVVGGLLNAGVTYWMDTVRGKLSAKATARQLFPILWDAEYSLGQVAETGRLADLPPNLSERIKAIDHSILASSVSDGVWLSLVEAEFLIEQACGIARSEALSPEQAANFTLWAKSAHDAIEALRPIGLPSMPEFPAITDFTSPDR